jgi:hypothetical protein
MGDSNVFEYTDEEHEVKRLVVRSPTTTERGFGSLDWFGTEEIANRICITPILHQ